MPMSPQKWLFPN
ncbi:hypothetical protein F383_21414 [Gossypium arboreum]|uniref:Uncharacterized protein n=1 Tax=Gossypium arboreum TaxID=29729 RepID=A0A0B0NZ47_GOSAR|nr:hypothetical protein F383_21414 [Gossypium arboreum]